MTEQSAGWFFSACFRIAVASSPACIRSSMSMLGLNAFSGVRLFHSIDLSGAHAARGTKKKGSGMSIDVQSHPRITIAIV
ncbi:MAG: hypothetical protein WBO24_10875 [Nitrospirales bacterium]